MDFSKEYVRMCAAAGKELQERWEPKEGDWIYLKTDNYSIDDFLCLSSYAIAGEQRAIYVTEIKERHVAWGRGEEIPSNLPTYEKRGYFWYPIESFIWIPRLDQLLEMISGEQGLQSLCYELYGFSTSIWGEGFTILGGSIEQMCLALVMREKFGKIWHPDIKHWRK